MDDQLKLCTFNVNGLGQKEKRLSVFKRLAKLNSIILLQETHSKPCNEKEWRDEWRGEILFNHGSSNSCGVATLIPPNANCIVKEIDNDKNGRLQIIHITSHESEYILANIYAPVRSKYQEQLTFIHDLKERLAPLADNSLIIGGDFNFYMSKQLDKVDSMSDSNDNTSYRDEIKQLLETYSLVDVYRVLNPFT